jgi:hypothetical protein
MTYLDRVRLLFGPYQPLPSGTGIGRRASTARDADVRVTSWTDARIAWPKCVVIGRKGAPAILVEAELTRAIRSESAAALCYWWGVSAKLVAAWRKAFGLHRIAPTGTAEGRTYAFSGTVPGKSGPCGAVAISQLTCNKVSTGHTFCAGCCANRSPPSSQHPAEPSTPNARHFLIRKQVGGQFSCGNGRCLENHSLVVAMWPCGHVAWFRRAPLRVTPGSPHRRWASWAKWDLVENLNHKMM